MRNFAAVMLIAAGCASPTIPDNIPPAPPPYKGERITAPVPEAEAAPAADEGFGNSAFDDADTTPASEPQPEADPKESEESEDSEKSPDPKKPTEAPANPEPKPESE